MQKKNFWLYVVFYFVGIILLDSNIIAALRFTQLFSTISSWIFLPTSPLLPPLQTLGVQYSEQAGHGAGTWDSGHSEKYLMKQNEKFFLFTALCSPFSRSRSCQRSKIWRVFPCNQPAEESIGMPQLFDHNVRWKYFP